MESQIETSGTSTRTSTLALVSLNATDLTVRYDGGQPVLSIPSLSITGHCIALLGRNGSGKSTFLKTALGVLSPQRGALALSTPEGMALSAQENISFCPESGAIFLDIAVQQYLEFWCRLRLGDAAAVHTPEASRVCDVLGVTPLLKKQGRQLSKGQRRRVHTAVGFLIQPRLFLFDEPFDGLDIEHAAALVSLIESYRSQVSFIISSHRLDIVERLCDAALILRDGTVIGVGAIAEVPQMLGARSLADALMR